VSWDIDKIDAKGDYESTNLALSCFACNTAKGAHLGAEEARVAGQAIRRVWDARLERARALDADTGPCGDGDSPSGGVTQSTAAAHE
jgi:hypothetical protein